MSASDPDRLTAPERQGADADAALRLNSLGEFVGQRRRAWNRRGKDL